MKLAFCLFKYFPFGGLQRDFLRIALASQARGHTIHVYTMDWQGDIPEGFQVHLYKPKGWQNHTQINAFATHLKKIFANHTHDLIIGFDKMPGLDVYYAADVCYQARKASKRFAKILPRYQQKIKFETAVFSPAQSTEILLISTTQQAEFEKYYQTPLPRFHLLSPGISRDRIAPANAETIRHGLRQNFSLQVDDILLLLVGSGFKTKGLDRAIIAFASLPPTLLKKCHLFVIGQDNPRTFIKLAQKLNVFNKIKFLGGRDDVGKFLLAADALLHPAYHENTGTVLLEAMIAGLPVLTTDVCGYAHYVSDNNAGRVVTSPFTQATFNAELLKFLSSPELTTWKQNGLNFSRVADIYSLPEKAATLIENFAHKKRRDISQYNFTQMMSLQGEVFRNQKGRRTQRITVDEQTYFLKQHNGVGWKEIIKNIVQLKKPVLGASNEKKALKKLYALNILVPQIISYSTQGLNPATQQSYILLEDLTNTVSLEDLCKHWTQLPNYLQLKNLLIKKVAEIARTMHENGINHRDFYICHFLLKTPEGLNNLQLDNLQLYLIDLHRAEIRKTVPKRWLIKDLAGLYFSSKNIGITNRDLLRFIKLYFGKPLREILWTKQEILLDVKHRGEKLYLEHIS